MMLTTKPMSSLELSILDCRRRDAAQFTRGLRKVWKFSTAPHDHQTDSLESAILACQKRDRDNLKNAVVELVNESRGPASIARA
jgi:hypothetical protein